MPIIAVVNHKGGCGKTTTAVNLSSALSANRKTVLLVDLDPQGHASLALGASPDDRATMFDVLDLTTDRPMRDIIVKMSATLHLAPSNIWLSALEQKLSGKSGREHRLRDKLAQVEKHYDYIVIDCPPSLGLLTINALLCSDRLIMPVEASVFSLQGIDKLRETIAMLRNHLGHDPEAWGLATMFDRRTNFAKAFFVRLRERFGENLFATVIPNTVKIREAAQQGVAIMDYDPFSKAAEAFLLLADEILRKDRRGALIVEKARTEDLEEIRYVTFSFPDTYGAGIVQLAGDFNDWDPEKIALIKNGEGDWVAEYPLRTGNYQYKYVVDGRWVLDPRNGQQVQTDGGEVNSVITVE